MKNYYELLGVSEKATTDEIKKSYRKMAMKWHPDRNQNNKDAEEKFKEIKIAYETLIDPFKRKNYDNSLYGKSEKREQNNSQSFNEFEEVFQSFFGNEFSDFFKHQQRVRQGEIHIGFWEAIFGCQKELQMEFTQTRNQRITFTVQIPAGTQNGEHFLIEVNGVRIELVVMIEKDQHFSRNNLDLFTEIQIPFTLAALGGKIKFPHWEGDIEVEIPPGTQNYQKILVANKGVKRNMFVGDLYLSCCITVPKKLSPKQQELIKSLQETEKETYGFFDSLKDAWKRFFKA